MKFVYGDFVGAMHCLHEKICNVIIDELSRFLITQITRHTSLRNSRCCDLVAINLVPRY